MTTQPKDSKRGGTQGGDGSGAAAYQAPKGMKQMQIRLTPQLKAALAAEAERLTERLGVPVSMTAVLRKFVAEGLQRAKGQR